MNRCRGGADLIAGLNAEDMTPGAVNYYAFYTKNDELVWCWVEGPFGISTVNYDNAILGAGATNVDIGEMCPFIWVGHLGMTLDPLPIHITLGALAGDPISVPWLTCLLPRVIL